MTGTVLGLALAASAGRAQEPAAAPPARSVAVTFDDLPAIATRADLANRTYITDGILGTLVREGVPAIGFVNEEKLVRGGATDPRHAALLERWLEAGMQLGNHTYSHPSLYRTPLEEFQEDVLRGERLIRPLMREHGDSLRWFRHPFLNTGPDPETKQAFERFLASHGYDVAPVTIDNGEWIFARAYDNALDAGDSATAVRVGADYIAYMDTMFGYYEAQSRAILGYEPPQVLLLHANRINADLLDELVAMMRARGYDFVRVEEAVRDPAYDRPDRYAGTAGITWLHRWAITADLPRSIFAGEMPVHDYVMELAGVESQ